MNPETSVIDHVYKYNTFSIRVNIDIIA